ncbi:MAG: ABC transporter substrate-binding protein [Planctomycetota bacterium]|jgi:tetratricopeptide (TPR) repeat protein
MMRSADQRRFYPRASAAVTCLRAALMFVLVGVLCVSIGTRAQAQNTDDQPAADSDQPRLPLLSEMELPAADELLTGDRLDWIVLQKEEVLVVQPVYPRPATLEKLAQQNELLRSAKTRPPRGPAETQEEYQERISRLIDETLNLTVTLPDDVEVKSVDQAAEYTLNIARNIDRIVYHEDLMLRRTDILIGEGNLDKAFEMLLVIDRTSKGWPGFEERRNRLIFEEAQVRLRADDLEAALAFFEELYTLAPEYAGLRNGIGRTIEQLVVRARQKDDLRQARYYITRLRQSDPEHPIAVSLTNQFIQEAADLLKQASAAHSEKKYPEAVAFVQRAARVWPTHPQLRNVFRTVSSRYQVLTVGVQRMPGDPTSFFLPTAADRRHQALLSASLFEVRRFDRAPAYQSRFFEEWTPTDLGRQIVFSLQPRRANWESTPVLTAPQVARAIGDRLKPDSEWYDERLATFVSSINVRSPREFEMNFLNVPVRPQALFRFPVNDVTSRPFDSAKVEGDATGSDQTTSVLSSRFHIHERTDDKVVFRRVIPQDDRLASFQVAEIVETKYRDDVATVQGLLSGDVSMVPNLPIWLADQFDADDRFFVEPYGVPTTHVLQFNPESKPLQNGEFRRALASALDRHRILDETVLRNPNSNRGRVVSAPFPSRSYAYDPTIEPRQRDLALAISLLTFAKKRFGGEVPQLTMICEPGDSIRQAAEEIAQQWQRFGINVDVISDSSEPASEKWDIVYRTVSMAEPVTELWPFLTMKPDARVEDLEHLPDWLRQLMIELEQSVDFNSSVEKLKSLHFRLRELVHVLPLWEIDDVIVIRKNIQGFPAGLTQPYQNVERWTVQPFYPQDDI